MSRTVLVLAAVGALAFGIVGCTSYGSAPDESLPSAPPLTVDAEEIAAATARGVILEAELDDESGAVVLPFDRFIFTQDEMDLLTVASRVLVAECAAAKGVTIVVRPYQATPIYASELFYGPWTVGQAERFGFVVPMADADLNANGIAGAPPYEFQERPGLTEEQLAVADECGPAATDELHLDTVLQAGGPWADGIMGLGAQRQADPEVQAATAELLACYERNDLRPGPAEYPWVPQGADVQTISEEQVRMALQVVACKDETGFTQRVADAEARLQAPIIVTYLDELLEHRAELDASLDLARQILADAGADASTTS